MDLSTLVIKERSSDHTWDLKLRSSASNTSSRHKAAKGSGSGSETVKFGTGILAEVNHEMNLKPSKYLCVSSRNRSITVQLKIHRPEQEKYKVRGGKLEFLWNERVVDSLELVFEGGFSLFRHSFIASVQYPSSGVMFKFESINLIRISFTLEQCTIAPNANNVIAKKTAQELEDAQPDLTSVDYFLEHKPDLTILCGEQSWLVHKDVLTANSPVFRQMFDTEMTEAASGQLLLDEKEISPKSVLQLLRFLYNGKMKESADVCLDLFVAGEKYDIGDLKGRCERYLAKEVSPKNALEMHGLAELHNGNVLKNAALAVMKTHKSKIFPNSGSLKDLVVKAPDLAFKVLLGD